MLPDFPEGSFGQVSFPGEAARGLFSFSFRGTLDNPSVLQAFQSLGQYLISILNQLDELAQV
jgi:hypothetical protein